MTRVEALAAPSLSLSTEWLRPLGPGMLSTRSHQQPWWLWWWEGAAWFLWALLVSPFPRGARRVGGLPSRGEEAAEGMLGPGREIGGRR